MNRDLNNNETCYSMFSTSMIFDTEINADWQTNLEVLF